MTRLDSALAETGTLPRSGGVAAQSSSRTHTHRGRAAVELRVPCTCGARIPSCPHVKVASLRTLRMHMAYSARTIPARGSLGVAWGGHWSGVRGEAHACCGVPPRAAHRTAKHTAGSSPSLEQGLPVQSLIRGRRRGMTSEGGSHDVMRTSSVLSNRQQSSHGPSKLHAAASDEPMATAGRPVPQLIEGVPLSPVMVRTPPAVF